MKLEGRYPSGANGESLPSYTVATGCDVNGTEEHRQAALADLSRLMAQPEKRQIEDWLAELSVISAKRRDGEMDEALRLEAYSSRLAQYPADVVHEAVLGVAWKFWPTWSELEQVCERMVSPRRQMLAALARPEEKPEPKRRAATEAEKKRMADLIAEKFPDVSQQWRDAAVDEAMSGECIKEPNAER